MQEETSLKKKVCSSIKRKEAIQIDIKPDKNNHFKLLNGYQIDYLTFNKTFRNTILHFKTYPSGEYREKPSSNLILHQCKTAEAKED